MPTYTFKCLGDNNHKEFDVFMSIKDNTKPKCTTCGNETKKIIKPSNFHLKGDKWFSKSGNY